MFRVEPAAPMGVHQLDHLSPGCLYWEATHLRALGLSSAGDGPAFKEVVEISLTVRNLSSNLDKRKRVPSRRGPDS
jgi:hypothetical protein